MINLLFVNAMRLWKSKCFWICVVFVSAAAGYYPLTLFLNRAEGFSRSPDDGIFLCAVLVPVALSIFCSLYLGTDYSDGVIRNKITVGHRRIVLYIVNLITSMAVALILMVAFFIVYLAVGIPLLGTFQMSLKTAAVYIAIILAVCFAFSGIFTMICMGSANKAAVAAACVLCAVLLLLAGVYLASLLQAPELYPGYSFNAGGEITDLQEAIPNPYYLSGAKREICQFFYDFLPGGQAVQCASAQVQNPLKLLVYSGITFFFTSFLGATIFQQKNIR